MSRIGKLPVVVPAGVEVKIGEGNLLTVKGPKGTLERKLSADMNIAMEDGQIVVTRPSDLKKHRALHGLTRTLIHNMVVGVTEGYEKKLEENDGCRTYGCDDSRFYQFSGAVSKCSGIADNRRT